MKKVFEPVVLRHLTLRNRLVRSATWEGIAGPDGSLPKSAFGLYSELARGGVGAIITGFTSVSREDFYIDGVMRLCSGTKLEQYKQLTDAIHQEGCPVLAQLALGAYYRKTEAGYVQVEPDQMTTDEIRTVIRRFAAAAEMAKLAGFDGVQIHAAHFFFLSRFISPAVNHRTDEYGPSRGRILLDILEQIRTAAPSLHVSIKINSSDFTPGGLDAAECLHLCTLLDQAGIDSIEISGNGTSVGGIQAHVNEGYFVPAAARIAEAVSCPVLAVGGFRSADTMEAVLNQTRISLISLSRPLLREPDLPLRMKADPAAVSKCVSCNLCYSSAAHQCIFRGRNGV